MQHPPQETQSEGHLNWIRCNLGLQEMGNAIRPHIDEGFREYHTKWKNCYYICCTDPNCTKLFAHCHNGKRCQYHNEYLHTHHENEFYRVIWNGHNWELLTVPYCDICHAQFINVKKLFRRPDSTKISWTNVEFPIWEKGHWELAKAFMPQGNRYTNTPTAAETTALLKILSTCKLFYIRKYKPQLVTSLIQTGTTLTHSSPHEITNNIAIEFFETLTEVLQMLNELCPCEEQLTNLQMLQETQLTAELIKRAYAAKIQDLLKSIGDRTASGKNASNLLDSLKSIIALEIHTDYEAEMGKLKEEIRTGMARETSIQDLVKEKEQMIEAKNTTIKELEIETKRLQEVKDREVKELTEEINKLKMRISKLLKDIKSKDDNSKELNGQLLLKDASIKNLEEENQKIRSQSKLQMDEAEKLEEKMTKMMALNEKQNITIQPVNDRVKMLEESKTELQRSREELEDTLTKLSAEKIKLEQTIDDLSALKKEEIKGLHEKIHQLNISNDERKKEIWNLSNILIVFCILTVIISVFFLRIGNFFYQK